jgi:hypothetical protein
MKKVLLFLLASCLSAYADWSVAPDGHTWLYLKPNSWSFGHTYSLLSADGRWIGGVCGICEPPGFPRSDSRYYPLFDGETSGTHVTDILIRETWRYLNG